MALFVPINSGNYSGAKIMDRREQDHREISEIQDILTHIKACSNNTIGYCINELNYELRLRRLAYEKAGREQARQAHEIDAGDF